MSRVSPTQLRSRFAAALSDLYGREVPAYTTLVDVSRDVNERVLERDGAAAENLGSISRVTAERHGAIRVGTPRELAQVARVFAAVGMHPVGFYDLRDAHPQPIPVVSTAFRPIERDELAANPFRVFTSMLVPQDRRFFDADLEDRVLAFLDARVLFPDELLDLADRAERDGGLAETDAARFVELATAAFALSDEPVDRAWYEELEAVSGVAADIAGVASTHINHLTPRVLDIDDLYRSMTDRGIDMIDAIQGPPRWEGPDVLLRQTSFRALAEPRAFLEPDGSVSTGHLRVRFGEVEARGIALTPLGREVYDAMVAEVDERVAADATTGRAATAADVWAEHLPATEVTLERSGLAFFSYRPADSPPVGTPPATLDRLLDEGWIVAEPIVYEDFLPRSAAGIFSSNLTDSGAVDRDADTTHRDIAWMSDVIGRPISVPEELYRLESLASLAAVEDALGVTVEPRTTTRSGTRSARH